MTKIDPILPANARSFLGCWATSDVDDVIKWKHFPLLLALYAGNTSVAGEFPSQRPVRRSFDIFFHLRLNGQLSKHYDVTAMIILWVKMESLTSFLWTFMHSAISGKAEVERFMIGQSIKAIFIWSTRTHRGAHGRQNWRNTRHRFPRVLLHTEHYNSQMAREYDWCCYCTSIQYQTGKRSRWLP